MSRRSSSRRALADHSGLRGDVPQLDALATAMEQILVDSDFRGMAGVRAVWGGGYLQRAMNCLLRSCQRVTIISGFPVGQSFETDGPVGALALAAALEQLGSRVRLVGLPDYLQRLEEPAGLVGLRHKQVFEPMGGTAADFSLQVQQHLHDFRPTLLVFVEVPGRAGDNCYYNMHGQEIGSQTACWELLLELSRCPSIAFADGGNEVGMGLVAPILERQGIIPASVQTDCLVLSDVSNWGVHGVLALASGYLERDLMLPSPLQPLLESMNAAGIVDGVTGRGTATEDGRPAVEGQAMIDRLGALAQVSASAHHGNIIIDNTTVPEAGR